MKNFKLLLLLFLNLIFYSTIFCQTNEYRVKKTISFNRDNNFGEHGLLKISDSSFGCFINYSFMNSSDKDTIQYYLIKNDSLLFKNSIRGFPSLGVGSKIAYDTITKSYSLGFLTCESLSNDSTFSSNLSVRIGILNIDSNGNINWRKKYEYINNSPIILQEIFYDNSNLYVLLQTEVSSSNRDVFLLKLDKYGNQIFNKNFGGNGDEYPNKISKITNNKYVIISYTESDNSGNKILSKKGYWFVEIDSNGNKLGEYILDTLMGKSDLISNTIKTRDSGWIFDTYSGVTLEQFIVKITSNYKIQWIIPIKLDDYITLHFDKSQFGELYIETKRFGQENNKIFITKINNNGKIVWSQIFDNYMKSDSYVNNIYGFYFFNNKFISLSEMKFAPNDGKINLSWLMSPKHKLKGSMYTDFNYNCLYNKPSEYNIKNYLIHNKTENSYSNSSDTNYTIYLFDRDTAILNIINLDSNLYVACGKDSIIVDMTGKLDTSGIDFPIRSTKSGSCMKIVSFSHSIMRPGRWGSYQLNYQNNDFDTAYNASIDVEIDTAKIDTISSTYSYTKIGNILRFQLGHIRPFDAKSISYSIKLKATVIIGSSICHRASIFPRCDMFSSPNNDSSEITMTLACKPNDTIEVQLKNIGTKDQTNWGLVKSYEDIIILMQDSFKLNAGISKIFRYKLDTNKVYTAEVFNNNGNPIHPILIRQDDQCTNTKSIIFNNPALNFNRHDEAREYEEDCDIVRGSYDPNIKSVVPIGMYSQHYTATGTELKYRIDFQNTGTDTAFRVVLIDTLSTDLNIASFIPGVSSHPYSIEFGGRAVKFIFDPIKLVDSFHNEPESHGFVTFKIKHNSNITPKTKIENKADIYFDYNTAVRTNMVFNTIFDTIQIYVPKADVSIQGQNELTTSIYPNPASEHVVISMNEAVKNLEIELIDLNGRTVQKQISKNEKTVELQISQLEKGIYILRCLSDDKLIVMKKLEIND